MSSKRKRGMLSFICVIFFVFLFGIFYHFEARADSMTTSATVAVGTIVYNGRSFTPNEIIILKGDALLFRNRSDKILDLASDPHPDRKSFPFLNIGTIRKNGGFASVLFLETGEYLFHNHAFPSHRGKVIVLDALVPKEPKEELAPPKEPLPQESVSSEPEEEQEQTQEQDEEEQTESDEEQSEPEFSAPINEENLPAQEAQQSEDLVGRESPEDVQAYTLAPFLNVDTEQANILIPPILQKDEGVSEYTIYLSENVQSATLDLRYYTLDTDVAKIPVPIRVVSLTAQGTIFLSFPEGAVIRGSSEWDEKIMLPTIKEDEWGLRLLNYTDDVFVKFMVRVGLKGQKLTLSKPARLLLPDVTDHLVGYVVNDVFTPITAVCDSDTPESAEQQLEAEGNCMIVRGSDIAVWTRHFTGFITYKDVLSTLSPPDSIAVPTPAPAQEERQFEPALRKTITYLLGGTMLLALIVLILFVTDRIRARKL